MKAYFIKNLPLLYFTARFFYRLTPIYIFFLTLFKAETDAGGIVLRSAEHTFHLNSPDAMMTTAEITLWLAYGASHPGTIIELANDVSLPWSGEVRLAVI